ncbi:MAG: KpsF/GutQ family sugar-phosphate isomerase [Phycisphaerales bacterium]|nr:KpsF/GutQ family sugar-phosphate isomerase [Phycisphaerales bacterium]
MQHAPAQAHPPSNPSAQERDFVASVIRAEADTLRHLIDRLGPEVHDAVDLITRTADAGGSVIVAGLGKSGLIGKKISATLASLGIPSHDLHPADAAHGDLGRVSRSDSLLALSYSGETDEVVALASLVRADGASVVSMTGGENGRRSALARASTVNLWIGAVEEACNLTLAPTSSTTAMLALGDALALAASRRRAFTSEDFHKRHPGGGLGGLLRPVTDLLRFVVGRNLPVVPETHTVGEALREAQAAGRRPGALILVNAQGALAGLFTDGDLRRLVLAQEPLELALRRPIREVMTRAPRTLPHTSVVRDAVRMFREFRQDEIPVVDEKGRPIGILDVQDLVAIRAIQD